MIRFIHAADLHLDTPFLGLDQISSDLSGIMREAPFQSFQNIVDEAIAKEVDFVLLSGDLYNTQKINIQAQSKFVTQLNRLQGQEIPVFLIRGNHDYLTEETKTLTLPLPDNVYTYTNEVSTHVITVQEDKKIAVSGFSYESQWVRERKIQEYPERMQSADMHIGMLHGDVESGFSTRAGNYAPFTLSELRHKDYDYWALGHIHKRKQLSEHPPAIYPGNIQGLHKNEIGEKGCTFVEWSERGVRTEFIPTAPITWESLTIQLANVEDLAQLMEQIEKKAYKEQVTENSLIHLVIEASKDDDADLIQFIQEAEFSEILSKQLNLSNFWIAQTEISVAETNYKQSLEELYPMEWGQAVEKTLQLAIFNEKTENILNNIPRKYVTAENTSDYREKMIKKAIAKIYLKYI